MELPLVTPQQIVAARNTKYVFTGDLNAAIKSYPPFSGKEKHLVRSFVIIFYFKLYSFYQFSIILISFICFIYLSNS